MSPSLSVEAVRHGKQHLTEASGVTIEGDLSPVFTNKATRGHKLSSFGFQASLSDVEVKVW